ncbi:AraC family transcriptional regulator [Nocardioides rubriscoriae]|uniref:AraC family transcriptional regulator n=1 Tax=Nocardioides rubriscoriae TaxID=642762 RepID=UPI0011DF0801|nr:AraC family transcriptional regulator [Nocardioides rubriscoriae]
MDLLHHHLDRARATGSAFARTVRHGPWGLRLDVGAPLVVHVVIEGRTTIWLDDDPAGAVELGPGDVAVVSGGRGHRMAHRLGARCQPIERFVTGDAGVPADGPRVDFLCGAYRFEGDTQHLLVDGLPPLGVVRPGPGDRLRLATDLLAWELAEPTAGQQTAVDRLLDLMLVLLIREAYGRDGEHAPAWYAAADDPRVREPMRAMHERPAAPWSVPKLAGLAGLSRARFARVFTELLGQTPMGYLTDLRMSLARDRLRDPAATLAQVAHEVGYADAYAFAAAFKREHGVAPGRWRQQLAATGAPT